MLSFSCLIGKEVKSSWNMKTPPNHLSNPIPIACLQQICLSYKYFHCQLANRNQELCKIHQKIPNKRCLKYLLRGSIQIHPKGHRVQQEQMNCRINRRLKWKPGRTYQLYVSLIIRIRNTINHFSELSNLNLLVI